MLKVNLHLNSNLHPELLIKVKENYILILIKINNIIQLDEQTEKLKKIKFQPSKIQISFFVQGYDIEKNETKKIKKKIINTLDNPADLNLKALAKIIAPKIYPVKDYSSLVQELSPINITKNDALEIIKIIAL